MRKTSLALVAFCIWNGQNSSNERCWNAKWSATSIASSKGRRRRISQHRAYRLPRSGRRLRLLVKSHLPSVHQCVPISKKSHGLSRSRIHGAKWLHLHIYSIFVAFPCMVDHTIPRSTRGFSPARKSDWSTFREIACESCREVFLRIMCINKKKNTRDTKSTAG